MNQINMERWHNGNGITLTFTHPYSPPQVRVVSLDFTDVEKLYSLLEDYRNAPNPFKMVEVQAPPDPCPVRCAFRARTQFGQWQCNNCPRIWSAPDGGRTMQPSEITRFLADKQAEQECIVRIPRNTGYVCNARDVRVIMTGAKLYTQCKGCGDITRANCASCPETATTMFNGETVCATCCSEQEAAERSHLPPITLPSPMARCIPAD